MPLLLNTDKLIEVKREICNLCIIEIDNLDRVVYKLLLLYCVVYM